MEPSLSPHTEPYEPPQLYTDVQQRILTIVPLFTAPLSVLGSSIILYTILTNYKNTAGKSVYHRIILGMSFTDWICSSSMIVLGPWAVNKRAEPWSIGARGSETTCDTAGFFLYFVFGVMWYSMFLALYVTLSTRYGWKEQTLARYFEPLAHFTAFLATIISGVYAVWKKQMNPLEILPGYCWSGRFPPNCHLAEDTHLMGPVCTRGANRNGWDEEGTSSLVIFIFCVIVICMILIVEKVRATEKQLRRYAGMQARSLQTLDGSCRRYNNDELKLTKKTGTEATLYILAFFMANVPIVLVEASFGNRHNHKTFTFCMALLLKFLTPCQGFFNAFIYLRKDSDAPTWARRLFFASTSDISSPHVSGIPADNNSSSSARDVLSKHRHREHKKFRAKSKQSDCSGFVTSGHDLGAIEDTEQLHDDDMYSQKEEKVIQENL